MKVVFKYDFMVGDYSVFFKDSEYEADGKIFYKFMMVDGWFVPSRYLYNESELRLLKLRRLEEL